MNRLAASVPLVAGATVAIGVLWQAHCPPFTVQAYLENGHVLTSELGPGSNIQYVMFHDPVNHLILVNRRPDERHGWGDVIYTAKRNPITVLTTGPNGPRPHHVDPTDEIVELIP